MKIGQLSHTTSALCAFAILGPLTYGVSVWQDRGSNDALPHTFQPGTPARAEEVNENFSALVNRTDIGGQNMVPGAVGSLQIEDGSVASKDLASGAVGPAQLAPNSVTEVAIAADAVGSSEIAANAVTSAEIAFGAVTSSKIADGAVTSAKIAANAVTSSKIDDDAITSSKIPDLSLVGEDVSTVEGRVIHLRFGDSGLANSVEMNTQTGEFGIQEKGVLTVTHRSGIASIETEPCVMLENDNLLSSTTVSPFLIARERIFTSEDYVYKALIRADGSFVTEGLFASSGADFAEMVGISTGVNSVQPGDVLVIDPDNYRSLTQSTSARSTLVAGIYSTKPGLIGSERSWFPRADQEGTNQAALSMADMASLHDEVPVAVVGIVPCKVSTENGPIRPGDLLVTSSTPGHAMRESNPATGTVVGKALQGLAGGRGVITVLVTLH